MNIVILSEVEGSALNGCIENNRSMHRGNEILRRENKKLPENKSLFNRIWELLTETPMHKAVRILAPKYFAEFGFQEAHKDRNGIESIIKLVHCEVHFYYWKWDLGSYIKPLIPKQASCNVAESSIPCGLLSGKKTWREVDRQMKLIIENYRPALEGDFSNWPKV